jgi:hypothetical protein
MGTSKFVKPTEMDDAFDGTGYEDTAFIGIDEKDDTKASSGNARKAIEALLEEKRLRDQLKDDFDDIFEA